MSDEVPPQITHHTTRAEDVVAPRVVILRRAALWLAVLGMLMTTGVAAYAAVAIRQSQKANKPTIDATAAAAKAAVRAAKAAETGTRRIEDCTTPGRSCYDDGQARTKAAVGDLNRVIVLAAACADRPGDQTVEEIQGCVIAKLSQQQREGTHP